MQPNHTIKASAPGKILIAGEYAVLRGHPAIVMAIDKRVEATIQAEGSEMSRSLFLTALHQILSQEFGDESWQAQNARYVHVDSTALYQDGKKLGLGSSAAVTVAATAACLATDATHEAICQTALTAHRLAQSMQGASGSGSDIVASTFGGLRKIWQSKDAEPGTPLCHEPLQLPPSAHWIAVWTGTPASTTHLVGTVSRFAEKQASVYEALELALGGCAENFAAACRSQDLSRAIAAIAQGDEIMTELAHRAHPPLRPLICAELSSLARGLDGAAKTTGAGGGDIVFGLFADEDSCQRFTAAAESRGLPAVHLGISQGGVTSG